VRTLPSNGYLFGSIVLALSKYATIFFRTPISDQSEISKSEISYFISLSQANNIGPFKVEGVIYVDYVDYFTVFMCKHLFNLKVLKVATCFGQYSHHQVLKYI
jgi:hypothetical protein